MNESSRALGRCDLSHRRTTPFATFPYGATYYPEHWSAEERAGDAARMAAAGFNVVRMAEFAWDLIEPEEGRFSFELFDDTIDALAAYQIHVYLCTPTATPPRWLTRKHPEILRVDRDGRVMQHGSRRHVCNTHPLFREYSKRITRAMAEHYGHTPSVAGWQTDNEFNCHFGECYCETCRLAFVDYLRGQYRDIDALNQAWGTQFWSQTYANFEDVELPRKNFPAGHNPSHMTDYYRFISHTITEFQHDQVAILRRVKPEWMVFHNGLFAHIDYRGLFTQDLDVLGWDCYPFFGEKTDARRHWQAYAADKVRALSGNFIIPEQQSNGGGWIDGMHATPEPGEMRMMFFASVAHGADGIQFFRWRTARYGAEEYWRGILDHDNIPRRRYREAVQIGEELVRVGPEVLGTVVRVDAAIASADQDVVEAHHAMPCGWPSPSQSAETIHGILLDGGYSVGLIHPEDDLRNVPLYIIPHWAVFKPEWVAPLTRYVEQGGVLVIGARTATKDYHNRVVPETPPGCLRALAGVTVEESGHINDPDARPLELAVGKDKPVRVAVWYEQIVPDADTDIVATWRTRHLAGSGAVSVRPVGSGYVYYVGTQLTEPVINALLPQLAERSGIQPLSPRTPPCVHISVRQNDERTLWFFINYSDTDVTAQVPAGHDLIRDTPVEGHLRLAAYDVAIIRTSGQEVGA